MDAVSSFFIRAKKNLKVALSIYDEGGDGASASSILHF